MEEKELGGGKTIFYKKLFSLVLPIAFQQFMLAAVSASDALMLGFVNQDSLSAVSLAGQITFVFNLFMGGLTMGTSILAAQYYGKGDVTAIEKIFAYVTTDRGRQRLSSHCSRVLSVHRHFANLPLYLEKYRVCHEKHGDWVKRRCYQYFLKCRADLWAALFS